MLFGKLADVVCAHLDVIVLDQPFSYQCPFQLVKELWEFCFYLFVSAGVQMYQDSSVQLPEMRADALKGESPAEFTINIDNDGAMNVNGAPIDAASLAGALNAARTKATEGNQHLLVAIRADKRQQFAVLDRVLQACRDAQVPNVAIRAMTPTVGGGGAR